MKLKELIDVLCTEEFDIVILYNTFNSERGQVLYHSPKDEVDEKLLNYEVINIYRCRYWESIEIVVDRGNNDINMADVLPTTTKEQRALELVEEFIKESNDKECMMPDDIVTDCPNNIDSCWQCWADYMRRELEKYDK